jgi:hypothetical protein
MTRFAAAAEILRAARLDGKARQRGDAVIPGLSLDLDMLEAHGADGVIGKQLVNAFDFLEAEHVGLVGLDELLDDSDAQPHRIDVPRRQPEFHDARLFRPV